MLPEIPEGFRSLFDDFMVLVEFRPSSMGGIERIPLEVFGEYNDRLCKAWGAFEFDLLIKMDGMIVDEIQGTKPPPPPPSKDAPPEAIRMDNSAGLKTLFRSIGARKFGSGAQASD